MQAAPDQAAVPALTAAMAVLEIIRHSPSTVSHSLLMLVAAAPAAKPTTRRRAAVVVLG